MKIKKIFTCQSCGSQSPKWLGRCNDCGGWNTFAEETYTDKPVAAENNKGAAGVRQALAQAGSSSASLPLRVKDIQGDESSRMSTQFKELDRVLGGGLVPGSLILIGGDPGIGKSTILMQALPYEEGPVLYVSGEESAQQIKLRALGLVLIQRIF